MYMKKLAAASTLAFGTFVTGGAQAAFPFDPVQVDLFLSGSSDVQNNLKGQLSNLFIAGYKTASDSTTKNGAHFFAVTGTLKSAAPLPSVLWAKTARITYRTRGGSVWGVAPIAREEQIQWMKMDPTTCSIIVPPGATATADYYCSPTGFDGGPNGRKADLGVSDVEPKMFKAPFNVELGKTQLNSAESNGLKSALVYQQVFGVPMTDVIPPSLVLTEAIVESMLDNSGLMHDWKDVPGAPLSAINPGSPPNKDPVVVCRHVEGGQAIANHFFLHFPCGSPVPPARMVPGLGAGTADDPVIIDPTLGYTVVENPSSGDVRSCLRAAQNGTNWTFVGDTGLWYQVTFSGTGRDTLNNIIHINDDTTVVAPYGAVGVLSYDSAGKESGWHFHDLNGFLTLHAANIAFSGRPATSTAKYALAAMMESPWEYFSEVTMQYRNGTNGKNALSDTPPAVNPATGNYSVGPLKTLADSLINILREPTNVNANLGNAALPIFFTPVGPASPTLNTNKVSKVSKVGDTCAKPKLFPPAPLFW